MTHAPSAAALALTIARRQLADVLAGPRAWLIVGVWSALVALAAWSGWAAALDERAAHAAGEAANRAAYGRWLATYEADPYRTVQVAAEHPLVLHLPPAPARALAAGAADAAGRWAQPTGYLVRELEGRKGELTPLGALFGALDLSGLVAVAGALFAIALGFDAVAGERTRGTLALHFVNPLGRGTFLLGKALGVVAAAAVALWIPLVAMLVLLALAGAFPAGVDAGPRVAAFAAAALAYLAFWGVAAVAGSALVRTPAAAFAGLAGLWLLLAIALPKIAVARAAAHHPLPPPAVVEQRIATLLEGEKAGYRARFDALKARVAKPGPADLARLRMAYYAGCFARVDEVRARHEQALAGRRDALDEAAALSPAFDFQLLAAGLAGTDGTRHQAFVRAADAYARELRLWPDRRLLAGGTTRPTWAELPPLGYREPAAAELAADFGRRLGWLLVAIALAAVAAWAFFRRADLRPQGG